MDAINLGRPTGPRLRDLSLAQEQALDMWLTSLLNQRRPNRREDMPVDFTRALATLAKRRGIEFRFTSEDMRVKRVVQLGRNVPGAIGGGSKRTVSVRDKRGPVQPTIRVRGRIGGGYVDGGGSKVEPWNQRDWRE